MLSLATVQVRTCPCAAQTLELTAGVAHHLQTLTFDILSVREGELEVAVDTRLLQALIGGTLPAHGSCDLERASGTLRGDIVGVEVHRSIIPFDGEFDC